MSDGSEARIQVLERQVRGMRLALCGIGIVLLAGVSLGLVVQQDQPREIRATALSIVDPKGKSRIQLSVDNDGLGNICVLAPNGQWEAKLVGCGDGLGVLMLRGDKNGGIKMGGGPGGYGNLCVGDAGGGLVLLSCIPKKDPLIQILGPNNRTILDTGK